MEMLERCPGCSVARELEPKKAEASPHKARPCSHCGYDGPFPPPEPELVSPRDSMPSFAGARAKLATATQDLFRLSGNYSIPVDPGPSDPPAPSVPEPISSTRKPEASMMFSLEALMKATRATPKPDPMLDQASDQLWSMQAATPLFGTSHDQALLTTPLKMEPAQSMDSMTLPSQTPNGRRWWPIVAAAGAGLALAAGGIWVFDSANGASPLAATLPPSAQAAIVAQPLAEPPGSAAPTPAGSENTADPTAANPGAATPDSAKPEETSAERGEAAKPSAEPSHDEPPVVATATAPESSPSAAKNAAVASTKPDSENDRASKDRTTKKPLARVEKPSAPLKLAAAVFAFDKTAAKSALNAAAEAAGQCGAGGAAGKGKIQVTFAPSGKVSDAQLVEGPFAGTTAGKCALRHFKAVKVPGFAGAPVTVAKSFKVD
jgi:hypothetical protein